VPPDRRGGELPPGPGAPAVWQTIAWMTRPGAFLRRVHRRFGDPATIRTYWTEEPMVLFSSPDAVRAVFRLDPAIAPAGQSWEFLRPFAGAHSILLLDGEEHLRERRLMQGPFHGERMRAFAPVVADLARNELTTWQGRVVALERTRELTLEIILRVVFGARDDQEVALLRGAIDDALATVRSLPWLLAMAVVQKDLGPRSPWGRFRVAVERFDATLFELLARRRARPGEDDSMLSLLLAQRDEDGNPPSDRHLRDQLVALLVGGHDSSAAALAWAFERLARHPAVQARLRDGDPAYLEAVVKEALRARPALTIAPRLLLEPWRSRDTGSRRGHRWRRACGWPAGGRICGRRPPSFGPNGGWASNPRPIRCRGSRSAAGSAAAPAPRSPRWRCARCCGRRPACGSGRRDSSPSAPGAACSCSSPTAAARCWSDEPAGDLRLRRRARRL
jgi:cytochrome P450